MLPISGRSSTEYERVRAKLAAHLSDRAVGDVFSAYLPLTGGASHPTVRRHTLVVAHWLEADVEPIETLPSSVPAVMTVAPDPGYVREPVHVHLAKGEQRQEGYLALNPQGLLPLLEDGKARISQSLAIIEYFERTRPEPPLLPGIPSIRRACARWPWSAPARCTRSTTSAC